MGTPGQARSRVVEITLDERRLGECAQDGPEQRHVAADSC